LRPLFLNWP